MRIFLLIVASILSICGGGMFAYLTMILMLSGDGGFIIFDVPPASQTLLYLSVTLLPFIVALYILNKKEQRLIIGTIMISFVASFVMSFIVILNQTTIIDFFRTPSKHVQAEIQDQVQHIINHNQLPYTIDQQESNRWTRDEAIRTVVYMNKIQDGEIEKKEVKPFLSTIFETDVKLMFNAKMDVSYVSVVIDKGEEISCTDISYCK